MPSNRKLSVNVCPCPFLLWTIILTLGHSAPLKGHSPSGGWAPHCACVLSHLSRVRLFSTSAPLFMEFFRQEYWSGLPCPPPRDFPNPGIELRSPTLQQILYHLSHQGSPRILEWVAYPFSRGSFQPRNQTSMQILYHLSYQGSPHIINIYFFILCKKSLLTRRSKRCFFLFFLLESL